MEYEAFRTFFVTAAQSQILPPIPPAITIAVPSTDSEDEVGEVLVPGSVSAAEGQSFIIHYRDVAGNESLRRISVWGIRVNQGGIPILVSKCHERQATRYFRVDRIHVVTDFDGVVREPLSEFYRDTFGFAWPVEQLVIAQNVAQERWKAIRAVLRDSGVALLSVLALSDGEAIPEEIGEILDYACACCSKAGIELTDSEAERLAAYIRQLRPTDSTVERTVEAMFSRGHGYIRPLVRAGAKVIEADGLVHSDELAALNALSLELTGEGAW